MQVFRRNPFLSGGRSIVLPGGSGYPLVLGDTIGMNFDDHRVGAVVIPGMFVGADLTNGQIKLNFVDEADQPFAVSDAVKAYAGAIAAELASNFIEAFPDFGIDTNVSGRTADPIPRYKDANDDPWLGFHGCAVVERVDTELGEMAVGSGNIFEITVGAGTGRGVAALRMDGKPFTFCHRYHVADGAIEPATYPLSTLTYAHSAHVDVGKPSYAELGFEEASRLRKVGDKASPQVLETITRVSARVAEEFLARRFSDIRIAIVEMLHARMRRVSEARAIVVAALPTESPAVKDFHRSRIGEFDELHDRYKTMALDLLEQSGPDRVTTADVGNDWQFVPRESRLSPRM